MKPVNEEEVEAELIAYQMGELPAWKGTLLRRRLERDPQLAAQAEEIAATLRMFADEKTPVPAAEIAERSWQRVRGAMVVLEANHRAPQRGFWVGISAGASVALLAVGLLVTFLWHSVQVTPEPAQASYASMPGAKNWREKLMAELRKRKAGPKQLNNRPGPLTVASPDAVADDPQLATHLDTAERVLTEVSHTDGPLPIETRSQVHRLLLANAVYHQSAEQHGDMATASVIDDLDRVLITLDAEPERNADAFRLQMNLGGVLFDLRILHHNETFKPER